MDHAPTTTLDLLALEDDAAALFDVLGALPISDVELAPTSSVDAPVGDLSMAPEPDSSTTTDDASSDTGSSQSSFRSRALDRRRGNDSGGSGGSVDGPMKNPSRERLQAELRFLREQVRDLQDELSRLETRRQEAATATTSNATSTATAPALWEPIARRQRRRRDDVEAENARLWGVLGAQLQVATSLEQLLRKRTSAAMIGLYEGARASSAPKRPRVDDAEGLEALWRQFLGDIDAAHGETDAVLRRSGVDEGLDDDRREFTVKTRTALDHGAVVDTVGAVDGEGAAAGPSAEELYVELTDVKLIPFAFAPAAASVWRAVKCELAQPQRTIHVQRQGPEHFTMQYETPCRSFSRQGRVHNTLAMKRFETPRRLTLVWRATSAHADLGGDWDKTFTEETGWTVVEPVEEADEAVCVIRTCVHLVPRWAAGDCTAFIREQLETGDFARLVIQAYEEDVSAITEAVENMLLGEAVEPSGGPFRGPVPSITFAS